MTGPGLSEAIRARRISRGSERNELHGFGGLAIRDGGEGVSIWGMVKTARRALDMAKGLASAPGLSREHRLDALGDCRDMIRNAFPGCDSIEV